MVSVLSVILSLLVIFFLQLLGKSGEIKPFVGQNGRKWVELSHAIGIFLLNDV